MKRNMFFLIIIVMMGLFIRVSYANDVNEMVKSDVKKIVGKVISFTNDISSQGIICHFLITGVSEQYKGTNKAVVIYVAGVNYMGYEVKEILYDTLKNFWYIIYYVPNKKGISLSFKYEKYRQEQRSSIYILSIN